MVDDLPFRMFLLLNLNAKRRGNEIIKDNSFNATYIKVKKTLKILKGILILFSSNYINSNIFIFF